VPASPLRGREEELTRIGALLADPNAPLVSITGRSGVGKTRLALEVASACGATVFVVDCARIRDPGLLIAEIATTLNVPLLPTVPVADTLAQRLRASDPVVILDGCEHLLDAAAALGELLDRLDAARFLVTSQAPLRLHAEHVVRLAPLPLPREEPTDRDELARQPAVALYCDRASAVDDRFTLNAENAGAITALVRELEGLPLAIELAAARAVSLPASEILSRLHEHRLDVLRAVRRDRPDRHHDLRAAIAWSYALLPPDAVVLLLRLSIVAGSFDSDDVEALSEDGFGALDALSSLVDLHFVDRVSGERGSVFVLVPSIREFAREQLEESGESDSVAKRWVGWLTRRARAAALAIDSAAEQPWRGWLDRAHVQLMTALETSIAAHRVDDALDIVTGLAPYWDNAGFLARHNELVDQAIEVATIEGRETIAFAEVLLWSARFGSRNRRGSARSIYADRLVQGEALARTVGDARVLLHAFAARMLIAPTTGDLANAMDAATEGLALARRHGSRWTARFEVWTAMLAHQTGDDERALGLGRSGLARARRGRDRRTIVLAAMLLAPLARTHPAVADEVPSLESVLAMARTTGQTVIQAVLLPMLAVGAAATGDVPRAASWCREGLEVASGVPATLASGYGVIATIEIAAAASDLATAARFHGMVSGSWDILAANMPPEYVDAHDVVVRKLSDALGPDAFAIEATRGVAIEWRDGLDEVLAYLRGLAATSTPPAPSERRPRLSPRQLDVMRLLVEGDSNKEIAQRLSLTPKTVMHHTSDIYRKLKVRGRSEAVSWALRTGALD
jgi:predicted ATPase/DNA-binding CsgD family transcriptional regulator